MWFPWNTGGKDSAVATAGVDLECYGQFGALGFRRCTHRLEKSKEKQGDTANVGDVTGRKGLKSE